MPKLGSQKDLEKTDEDTIERIPTGVPGLDNLLEGGFPHPSTILLTGNSGTGKTVLGLQYLYNGVKQEDQPGIYLSVQAHQTDVTWYCSKFNLDIAELQEERELVVSNYEIPQYEQFHSKTAAREINKKLGRIIDSVNAKRIVIDSITPFGYLSNSKADYRELLYKISQKLKEEECTTIMISSGSQKEKLTPFEVEPYLADGVIKLSKEEKGRKRKRTLHINKMTATRTPLEDINFNLSEEGFKLLPSYYG